MRRGGASSHQGGTFARSSSRTRHGGRSEEHTSELQSRLHLVCRLLLEKKKKEIRRRKGVYAILTTEDGMCTSERDESIDALLREEQQCELSDSTVRDDGRTHRWQRMH